MKRTLLVLFLTLHGAAFAFTSLDRAAVLDASHQCVPPTASVRIARVTAGYCKVQVSMRGADPATMYLRGSNGHWKVIAGPGTSWTPAELNRLGVPPSLR